MVKWIVSQSKPHKDPVGRLPALVDNTIPAKTEISIQHKAVQPMSSFSALRTLDTLRNRIVIS